MRTIIAYVRCREDERSSRMTEMGAKPKTDDVDELHLKRIPACL